MKRIATTDELAAELRQILAYAGTDHPSRSVLAGRLDELSVRVAAAAPPYRYLPQEARDKQPVDPEGSDASIWTYEIDKGGRTIYYAIAYVGKQGKPYWHHSFGTNEGSRDRAIRELIKDRKERAARKVKEREDKRNFKTDLFAGDILYTSWGYDQTNVDFYEVIEVLGNQTVTIREVSGKVVKGDGLNEQVVAVPGSYVGPIMKKRVSQGDNVRITSYSSAHKWDGRPLHQTGPYGGH